VLNCILASNDDMHQIRKVFEKQSFSNITDHKLSALMQKFRKETNLGIENYQFHVDVGKDLYSPMKMVAAIPVTSKPVPGIGNN